MKRNFFYTAIFITTILFGTISFANARGPGRDRCNGPDQKIDRRAKPRNIDTCISGLDLSSEQIALFRKVREEHMENMDRIRDDMHKYRNQKRKQFQKVTDIDEKSLENLLNQGSELWKERERERLSYRQQVSALLTQEQKDRLYICKSFRSKSGREHRQGRPIPPED
jgi:Spy/CpxP family protein refolding chaperone